MRRVSYFIFIIVERGGTNIKSGKRRGDKRWGKG